MSGYAPREVRKVPNEVPKWPTAVGATRRTAVHHLVLDRSRSSRNRCPIGNAGAAELDTGQSVDLTDTPLEPGVQSADVRVTWHDPDSGFEVEEIDVIRDDDVVTRIGPEDIQTAYGTSSSRARVSGRRGRGFRTLHIRRLRAGGRLRIIVRAQRGRRGGMVYGRVTLSRRQT
jgi:hypothetical protein